jgi:phage terminase large subunit-like protein
MTSYRDKYRIENVGILEVDANYTYLEIELLSNSLNVTAKYGNIDISTIDNKVMQIDLNVDNTDIEITKPKDRSITVEAVYSEKAGLYFPVEMINKKTAMEDEEKKLVKTTGMVGNSLESPLKLNIRIPSGNLRIK